MNGTQYQEKAQRTLKRIPKMGICRTDSQSMDWLFEHTVSQGKSADTIKKRLIYKEQPYNTTDPIVMDLKEKEVTALHMLLGVVGETGEFTDACLRYFGTGDMDVTNLKEEIGDLLWYLAGMCENFGFSIGTVMEANIRKLEARSQSNSVTDDSKRDRQEEAEAINSTPDEV